MTPRGPVVTGHVVAGPDGRRVLMCRRDPATHMLRVPRAAWAMDAAALRRAEDAGCVAVRVVTPDGTWEAPVRAWRDHGVPVDRGHGAQVALPADGPWWTMTPAGPRHVPEAEATQPTARAVPMLPMAEMGATATAGRWWA